MMGRSGLMTQSQSMFIAWESGLEGDAVHIRHRNRSRWVELAELHPDDAEMLALAILEAVKKVRNE